jgi:ElaA protein
MSSGLVWHCWRFHELSVDRLYDVLALRCQVFIVEQGPYQDLDGVDRHSAHLLGRNSHGDLLAYLRVVDPGIKYPEASIGRVITAPKVRGTGLGRLLIREGVRRCHLAWPGRGIRISAQSHLQPFYTEVGFVGQGEDYLEDGIPHREMLLAWPEGQS